MKIDTTIHSYYLENIRSLPEFVSIRIKYFSHTKKGIRVTFYKESKRLKNELEITNNEFLLFTDEGKVIVSPDPGNVESCDPPKIDEFRFCLEDAKNDVQHKFAFEFETIDDDK